MKQNIIKQLIFSLVILGASFSITSSAQEVNFGIFIVQERTEITNQSIPSSFVLAESLQEPSSKNLIIVAEGEPMDLTDLKKTEVKGNNIHLYFTYKGAKKWAKLSKEAVGKSLAMVVDNKVYAMPMVNAQIKSGQAVIPNLKDHDEAVRLNKFLLQE